MLIPYRVKNAVNSRPYVTATIVALNVIAYALTTDYLVLVREEAVEAYGFSLHSGLLKLFTSMFMHADITHIGGNMLFLWLFGRAVEDRLGPVRYLLVYFGAGIVGALLQGMIEVATGGKSMIGIGASGCIMGVVGAYWCLFPWSTVCVWFWVFLVHGVREVKAVWIIGVYVLLDLIGGAGSVGRSGGVAHFAHLGGVAVGALACLLMRAKRDTSELSDARAAQDDARDLQLVPYSGLLTLLKSDYANTDIIRALIPHALRRNDREAIHRAMANAGPVLIEKDPTLVAYYLTDLRGDIGIYQPVQLLRLASSLEQAGQPARALNVYLAIAGNPAASLDAETALYRAALCAWNRLRDAQSARASLMELRRRFPNGQMMPYAATLWRQIGQ